MNHFKEIQELLRLITKLELAEFKLKEGDFELSVRTKFFDKAAKSAAPVVLPAPLTTHVPTPHVADTGTEPAAAAPSPTPAAPVAAPAEKASSGAYLEIRSPIVGTFYRSPSPDKPAYVKPGDVIKAGDVVCIVEAMKLFNEIESEHSGTIVKIMVEDASPVEFDQVLFLIDPKG